jgi:hypothetical protein
VGTLFVDSKSLFRIRFDDRLILPSHLLNDVICKIRLNSDQLKIQARDFVEIIRPLAHIE